MDADTRNTLRSTVTGCRKILETAISELLEGKFGIDAKGKITPRERMTNLSSEEVEFRSDLIAHIEHIEAGGYQRRDAVEQLTREVAFTHLNRLCAYKILERQGYIRESVSRGTRSNGFLRYCADHPEADLLYSSGDQEGAYRRYLGWLGATLNEEIGVLFSPTDSANRLFPPQRTINAVIEELNAESLAEIWESDETIGWIYQYFTPKELRDKARKASPAPRNSYELAFLNQFFTPRYVVQFLTDNTLGRTWYEMRRGETVLAGKCDFLVHYPDEVFLSDTGSGATSEMLQAFVNGNATEFPSAWELAWSVSRTESVSADAPIQVWEDAVGALDAGEEVDLVSWKTQDILDCLHAMGIANRFNDSWDAHGPATSALAAEVERRIRAGMDPDAPQETLLRSPQLVPFRAKKDPRDLRILDPACGSGHFLLYCFDLLETIYREAWEDEEAPAWSGSRNTLRQDYPDRDAFFAEIPGLILRHNLHGIDIDLRATQIASLALWLRAQRSFQDINLDQERHPRITKANIVCAEPMPGSEKMLEEFVQSLYPPLLGDLVRETFEKMKCAGEAGSLLKIEEDIRDAVADAKKQWLTRPKDEQTTLFPVEKKQEWQVELYSFEGISDESFWNLAEQKVLEALHAYARRVANGAGYRRKLFAEDAEQGFAFIELCQKEYDVVLMNPPFGAASKPSKKYIDSTYPRTKSDVYAAFVERWIGKLVSRGRLGAITSRTGFFLSSFQKWREEILLGECRPVVVADLGYGVLDTAMVETAAYCLEAL
jgi:23S rRNA G2445 N2-methylase RlmL